MNSLKRVAILETGVPGILTPIFFIICPYAHELSMRRMIGSFKVLFDRGFCLQHRETGCFLVEGEFKESNSLKIANGREGVIFCMIVFFGREATYRLDRNPP